MVLICVFVGIVLSAACGEGADPLVERALAKAEEIEGELRPGQREAITVRREWNGITFNCAGRLVYGCASLVVLEDGSKRVHVRYSVVDRRLSSQILVHEMRHAVRFLRGVAPNWKGHEEVR